VPGIFLLEVIISFLVQLHLFQTCPWGFSVFQLAQWWSSRAQGSARPAGSLLWRDGLCQAWWWFSHWPLAVWTPTGNWVTHLRWTAVQTSSSDLLLPGAWCKPWS